MWIALLGCTAPADTGQDSSSNADSAAHSEEPDETGETSDTDTGDTAPIEPVCPDGLIPVGDSLSDPDYCIFQYEAHIVDGVPTSVEGVIPTTAISFYEALEMCADSGMWLATSDQWEDAADGVVGEGGSTYPYGDQMDDAACVTPTVDGEVVYESLQPTGSLETCVSPFGVYDSSGNAFEWADPQLVVDIAAFLALFPELSEDEDGYLVGTEELVEATDLQVAGVQPFMTLREDGRIEVALEPDSWEWADHPATGYLFDRASTEALPLTVGPLDETFTLGVLTVREDQDGTPRTDKRGGAYYAGSAYGTASGAGFLAHVPEFDGTISFRCASEPL
ncbi:MAG: formylglycine-generating enzyme family protein [Proteobacteria bacterium]|nr:formylglycine-generating enzyme family protein [Pseudomonadota bacterium]MCP4920068.1 formylglycine-generating enzyme family protein [Pseudomonadota bacterium]